MVLSAHHRWPERAGFLLNRPVGIETYTFLHFFSSVHIRINENYTKTRPHACLLYQIGTPQWFQSEGPLLHDWMHLDSSATPLLEKYGVPVNEIFYPADISFITSGIYEIELEILSKKTYHTDLADVAAHMLLIRLGRAGVDAPDVRQVDPETRARLLDFRSSMMTRLGEVWSAAQMAHELRMSVPRMYACYRQMFGVPPVEDLIHARIDAAKNALTAGNISISNLDDSLGYANITHFSRQFRQRVGVSPRDFARKYCDTAEIHGHK